MTLAFSLDRTIEIRARRSTVFRFFTDPARWARWWGEGSTIDPVVGGAVLIVYPGGSRASGVVREIEPDHRLVFSYGYEGAGRSIGESRARGVGTPTAPPAGRGAAPPVGWIAPGGSLVTITLDELPGGMTRLALRHDVDSAETRDAHVQGWRHQLARFADIAAGDARAGAGDAIAAWFAGWNEPDGERRRARLAPVVTGDVRFRDANGDVYGLDELLGHIAAVQRFAPGVALEARGSLRRAHDVMIADWAAVRPDGSTAMSGSNVVRFASDGRIADVVGVA